MTQRDRIVVGVFAVIAVIAGFYVAVLKPTTAELTDLDDQIAQADTRRDAALSDLATASAAREQYKRDSATLAVLGKAVPADDGVPSLLYQLHRAARTADVDFDDITIGEGAASGTTTDATPGATAGPEGLQQLPLKIKFEGTFAKLDRFLDAVHRFAKVGDEKVDIRGRLLTVQGVALNPGEGGLPALTAEITALAYVAPPKGAAASGSGSGTASTDGTATASTPSTEQTSGASE